MPTYQYTCTSCDHDMEAKQSFTDKPLVDCPTCGEGSLRKQFGSVGVVFKGSGFYRNDSRNAEGADKAKSNSGSADTKSDGSKSETKTETTKSETKTDSKKTETKKADKPAATTSK